MDVSNWIALGILVVTLAGFIYALARNARSMRQTKKDIDAKSTIERVELLNKVNQNAVKIVQIWKEMEEMKQHHKEEIESIRHDLRMYDKNNREDFKLVHSKIDDAAKQIAAAAALLKNQISKKA